MSLSFETRVVTENSSKRLGGYEIGITYCYFASLLPTDCKGNETCRRKFAIIPQVTKIVVAKSCNIVKILRYRRAVCPANEGIETESPHILKADCPEMSRGLPR